MGNLSGITGTANEYGLIAGTGYTSSDSYLKLSTSGVLQNNVNSTWRSGGTTFLEIDPSSGINITIPDDAPMYSRSYSFKNSAGTNISSLWAWYSTVDSSNRLELFAGYAARKNMIDIIASSDSTHDADVLLRAAGRDQQADMFMLTSTSGSSVNFSGITRLFSVDAPLVQFDNAANFWINANATADTYLHFSSFIDTYIKWTYSATGTLRYIDISAGATSRVRLGNGNGFSLEADSNEVYVNGTATINGAVTVNGNPITVSGVSQAIKLVASAAGSSAATYMSFFDSNDVRKGFVGDSSSSNSDIYLYSDTAGVKLGTATNADTLVVSGGSTLINQSSTTLADAALKVFQADASEEFVDWQGAVGAGNAIDTAALGSYYGKIRVAVNGTFKFMALYNS
jgi:phage baseplate assembly protein gpV